jgi:hypothetical protein
LYRSDSLESDGKLEEEQVERAKEQDMVEEEEADGVEELWMMEEQVLWLGEDWCEVVRAS